MARIRDHLADRVVTKNRQPHSHIGQSARSHCVSYEQAIYPDAEREWLKLDEDVQRRSD